MTSLKAVLLGALFSLVMTGCGQPAVAPSATQKIEIAARVEPEPLAIGPATLIVTLRDASGSPVDGASLRVHADMDHEGMSPLDRETTDSSSGEYRVPIEWTMGGGWIVSVTARLPDGSEVSQNFEFFVEAVSGDSIINQSRGTPVPAEATAESGAKAVDEADIQVAYQTESATVGAATLTITVTEVDGTPVTNATIAVTGDMAHGGMMPLSSTGTYSGEGHYTVPLTWTMAGDWIVTVQITLADGRQFEQTFDQAVVMP